MLERIGDGGVRRAVHTLYFGSGVLFLATIALGILNATGGASRGQILAHFHSGTIGWVTLSVLATTVWVFAGERSVDERFRNFAWLLAGLGLVSVAGYVAAFGLAFNGLAPFWMLPLFGIPTGLVVISGLVFAGMQLKHQPVLTTVHLLLFGALLVASLGAIMGILVGLDSSHADLLDVFPEAGDSIGAHAAPMDMYLALAFGAIAELLLRKDASRWTKPGMTQMVLGVASGFLASLGLFFGIEPAAPLALLLFLVAFGFFLVRIGWRGFTMAGKSPAVFWGSLSFPAYIILFVVLVFVYFIPGDFPPHAAGVAFVHVTFVGMATNFLFALQSRLAPGAPAWESVGVWILNLGMLAFFAGEFMAGRSDGAYLMAAGALIVWFAVVPRHWPGTRVDAAR